MQKEQEALKNILDKLLESASCAADSPMRSIALYHSVIAALYDLVPDYASDDPALNYELQLALTIKKLNYGEISIDDADVYLQSFAEAAIIYNYSWALEKPPVDIELIKTLT